MHLNNILKEFDIEEELDLKELKAGIDKLIKIKEYLKNDDLKSDYEQLIKAWKVLTNSDRLDFMNSLAILKSYKQSLSTTDKVGEPKVNYGLNYEKDLEAIHFDLQQYEDYWKIYARTTPSDLKSLAHFKTQLSLGLITPITTESGIILSTIHLSKGLEFKIVFVVGLEDGSLPFYKSKQKGGKSLEEEKNIFYVAITRAKRALYLSYPKTKLMPWDTNYPRTQNPSEYLAGLKQFEN